LLWSADNLIDFEVPFAFLLPSIAVKHLPKT
jgi:hypothetical protein